MKENTHCRTTLPTKLWRLCRLAFWLAGAAATIYGYKHRTPSEQHQGMTQIANKLLKILHIHIENSGAAHHDAPLLLVANHISWLDIFVLMSQYPCGFIAKKSIRHWPLIGTLAERVGTVFIDRTSRHDVAAVNQTIMKALYDKQNVAFFPEARTSDGHRVLPFKAALFQSAVDTATPVQAVALRYYDNARQRTDQVAYVGETPLLASVWRVIGLSEIYVRADHAPLIDSRTVIASSRYQLKSEAEQFVSAQVAEDAPTETETDC